MWANCTKYNHSSTWFHQEARRLVLTVQYSATRSCSVMFVLVIVVIVTVIFVVVVLTIVVVVVVVVVVVITGCLLFVRDIMRLGFHLIVALSIQTLERIQTSCDRIG